MKGDRAFRQHLLLIAFGVTLFAALTHLSDLWQGVMGFFGLLSPILLGGAFALILNVPMRGFENLFARADHKGKLGEKGRTALALVLTILIMPIVVMIVVQYILPQFFAALNGVIALVRDNSALIGSYAAKAGLDPNIVNEKIAEIIQWASQNLGSLAGTAISTAASVVGSVASGLMSLMLAIYLLANKNRVKRQFYAVLYAFVPRRAADEMRRVGQMFIRTFSIFISRQCLEAAILGAMLFLGMMVLGIPYAVSLACLTAVLALIPFVGAYMSFFIGFTMIVMADPSKAVIFAVWFVLAQQIEGNVIYPHIVGGSVGLPAYVTLMGVFLGGALAGIPGMVLIIPVVSVIYQLVREAVANRAKADPSAIPPAEAAQDPGKAAGA